MDDERTPKFPLNAGAEHYLPDFRIGTPLLEFWLELLFARQAKKQ